VIVPNVPEPIQTQPIGAALRVVQQQMVPFSCFQVVGVD